MQDRLELLGSVRRRDNVIGDEIDRNDLAFVARHMQHPT